MKRPSKCVAGRDIAMKIPSHESPRMVEFYRDILGLPLIEEETPNIVFEFSGMRLWLDRVDHMSQAEICLEIESDNTGVISRVTA